MEVLEGLKLKESLGLKGTKEIDGWEQITRFGKSFQDILDWRNLINLLKFAFLAGLLCLVFMVLLVSR